jgi:hypothetical protein
VIERQGLGAGELGASRKDSVSRSPRSHGSDDRRHAGPPVTIVNSPVQSPVCPNGNSVSVFAPDQQGIQVGGAPITVTGDFSAFPGDRHSGQQITNNHVGEPWPPQ